MTYMEEHICRCEVSILNHLTSILVIVRLHVYLTKNWFTSNVNEHSDYDILHDRIVSFQFEKLLPVLFCARGVSAIGIWSLTPFTCPPPL